MTDLLTRPLLRRDEPAWGSRVPWLAALLAASWALVAGLAICVLPGTVVWFADGAEGPVADPLRFGARVWLVAHRAGLTIDGTEFTLAPLGLTVIVVALLYRSARWAAHSAGVNTMRGALAVIGPAVGTYMIGAGVVAGVSATSEVYSVPLDAVTWSVAWAFGATVVGVLQESGLLESVLARLSERQRAVWSGGAAMVAGLVVCGSVLVALSAAANSSRIGALAEALDAGGVGTTLLAIGGAAFVPNAVVWGASFALGPGFAVGAGTSVAPGGVELGLVPAIPAFGALPRDVPDGVTWLVLVGPIVVGIASGIIVLRRLGGSSALVAAAASAGAALAGAVGMVGLAVLSGGAAGATRLAVIGALPWKVGVATLIVAGVPCVAVVVGRAMWSGRS